MKQRVQGCDILKKQGIPYEWRTRGTSGEMVLREEAALPRRLRGLGFRLGHGLGAIRYLVYYQGRYCGIVV